MTDLLSPNKDITVRPTTSSDVFALANNLREDDVQEILDMTGQEPLEALGMGYVESSKCWTVLYKGVPAGMMGVVPSDQFKQFENPKLGHVWLLGSEQLALFGFSLVKYARAWLRELMTGYDVVGNVVSARNPAHVRFLKHVGATVVATHDQYGAGKIPAYEFVFTAEDLQEKP